MSVSLSAKLVLAAAQICAMVNLHPYISPVDQVWPWVTLTRESHSDTALYISLEILYK